jgi:hypothetical protein
MQIQKNTIITKKRKRKTNPTFGNHINNKFPSNKAQNARLIKEKLNKKKENFTHSLLEICKHGLSVNTDHFCEIEERVQGQNKYPMGDLLRPLRQ